MIDGEEDPTGAEVTESPSVTGVSSAETTGFTAEEVMGALLPSVTTEDDPSASVTRTEDQFHHEANSPVPSTPAPLHSTVCQKRPRSLSPQSPSPLRKKLHKDVFGNRSLSPKTPSPSPSSPQPPPLSPLAALRKKFHLEFGMPWITVS